MASVIAKCELCIKSRFGLRLNALISGMQIWIFILQWKQQEKILNSVLRSWRFFDQCKDEMCTFGRMVLLCTHC